MKEELDILEKKQQAAEAERDALNTHCRDADFKNTKLSETIVDKDEKIE